MRGFHLFDVGRVHQHAAEVAVGDDPQNLVAFADHGGTEAFVGHLDDDARQVVVGAHLGAFVADV